MLHALTDLDGKKVYLDISKAVKIEFKASGETPIPYPYTSILLVDGSTLNILEGENHIGGLLQIDLTKKGNSRAFKSLYYKLQFMAFGMALQCFSLAVFVFIGSTPSLVFLIFTGFLFLIACRILIVFSGKGL